MIAADEQRNASIGDGFLTLLVHRFTGFHYRRQEKHAARFRQRVAHRNTMLPMSSTVCPNFRKR
jgi:hypothetical protein